MVLVLRDVLSYLCTDLKIPNRIKLEKQKMLGESILGILQILKSIIGLAC